MAITRTELRFNEELIIPAVRVSPSCSPADALFALNLPPYHSVIAVHGGAAGMDETLRDTVRHFIAASLVPLAERRQIVVADGGTHVGVPRIIGEARHEISGKFPLVGVMPYRFALLPGQVKTEDEQIALDPSHSHFIMVNGEQFGDESPLLVGLVRATKLPGVAVIINGGDIVLNEVKMHAAQGNTVIVVRGSGRAADQLADPDSPYRAAFADPKKLKIASLNAPGAFTALLDTALAQAAQQY